MKKHIVILVIAFMFLVSGSFGWYYTDFDYRRPINITEQSGNTLTDYQVAINITYDSDMNSDFSDIRFTWLNESSGDEVEIPYWIENKSDSSWAYVWIKVPEIPANDNATVYVYYGNPDATSESNETEVFEMFEDFRQLTSLPSTWTADSYVSISFDTEEGIILTGTDTTGNWKTQGIYYNAETFSSFPFRIKVLGWNSTTVYSGFHLVTNPSTTNLIGGDGISFQARYPDDPPEWGIEDIVSGDTTTTGRNYSGSINPNQAYNVEIIGTSSTTQYLYADGQLQVSDTLTQEEPFYISFTVFTAGGTAKFKVVFMTKYTDPEPTYTVGDEENLTASVSISTPKNATYYKVNITTSVDVINLNGTTCKSYLDGDLLSTFDITSNSETISDNLTNLVLGSHNYTVICNETVSDEVIFTVDDWNVTWMNVSSNIREGDEQTVIAEIIWNSGAGINPDNLDFYYEYGNYTYDSQDTIVCCPEGKICAGCQEGWIGDKVVETEYGPKVNYTYDVVAPLLSETITTQYGIKYRDNNDTIWYDNQTINLAYYYEFSQAVPKDVMWFAPVVQIVYPSVRNFPSSISTSLKMEFNGTNYTCDKVTPSRDDQMPYYLCKAPALSSKPSSDLNYNATLHFTKSNSINEVSMSENKSVRILEDLPPYSITDWGDSITVSNSEIKWVSDAGLIGKAVYYPSSASGSNFYVHSNGGGNAVVFLLNSGNNTYDSGSFEDLFKVDTTAEALLTISFLRQGSDTYSIELTITDGGYTYSQTKTFNGNFADGRWHLFQFGYYPVSGTPGNYLASLIIDNVTLSFDIDTSNNIGSGTIDNVYFYQPGYYDGIIAKDLGSRTSPQYSLGSFAVPMAYQLNITDQDTSDTISPVDVDYFLKKGSDIIYSETQENVTSTPILFYQKEFPYLWGDKYQEMAIQVKADDYATTEHYLINFTHAVEQAYEWLHLRMLNSSKATAVKLKLYDASAQELAYHYIRILRFYYDTGTFVDIGTVKTDINGEATYYFIPYDVWYKFVVIDPDGNIIHETGSQKIQSNEITIQVTGSSTANNTLSIAQSISYSLIWNDTSKSFVAQVHDSSGKMSQACMNIYEMNIFNATLEKSVCATGSSVILTYTPSEYQDKVFKVTLDVEIEQTEYTIDSKIWDFSTAPMNVESLFGFVILFTTLTLAVAISPRIAVLISTIALLIGLAMGLIFVSLGAVLSLVMVGVLIFIRMRGE